MLRVAAVLVLVAISFIPAEVIGDAPMHWAYVAPRRPPLPQLASRDAVWAENPIDLFVRARLLQAGMSPSPPADRATLARRWHLDITGLSPSPAELDAFLLDQSPGAALRKVRELVASPRYGERLAQHWLDAARYADTHGYLIDPHRDMWRWRDWVIEALNSNMPFDQFTIEQLAGDLLPNATLEQRVATGFCRNHMVNYENGAIAEAYRAEYVHDRVSTLGTVWLGQTLECARCHDHKYDPFTMQDYYQLFAFFNNVAEQGLDGDHGNAAPFVTTPTAEQQRQLQRAAADVSRLEGSLVQLRQDAEPRVAAWEASATEKQPVLAVEPARKLSFNALSGDSLKLEGTRAGADSSIAVASDTLLVPGKVGQALLCNGSASITSSELSLEGSPGWTIALWLYPTTQDPMVCARATAGQGKQRVVVSLDESRLAVQCSNSSQDALSVAAIPPLALRRWQHVLIRYSGGVSADELKIHVDGRAVEVQPASGTLQRPLSGQLVWEVGGSGEGGFRGLLDEFALFDRALSNEEATVLGSSDPAAEILALPRQRRTAEQQALLKEFYLAAHDPEFRRTSAQLAQAQRRHAELLRAVPTTMVMVELPEPRATHVLHRGEFDRPGKRVYPDVPAWLPNVPAPSPRNRLGLARWLVSPQNPLTARVTVNRIWQHFFGAGLVRTPEDFGTRGESPSHPELLDWLAVEFVESGWDVKHLVELIVTSATYQQSSVRSAASASDPENRWLSRASRLRLDAESLRDNALQAGGLLDCRLGGASVFPYQPAGLWEEVSFNPAEFTAQVYSPSHGKDLYRRSLYTFWKRTLPPPAMTIFDAPPRETCTVARPRTNTPMQALALMNEPAFVEAARAIAQRALQLSEVNDEQRAAWAFRLVTARFPDAEESAALIDLLRKQRARFRAQPEAASQLLAVGESDVDPDLSQADLAAWTVVASTLLCLDEAVTRS